MKKILIGSIYVAVILLACILNAGRASADQSFYIDPAGSDSNDCLTAATACQTPNRVFAVGINKQLSSNVNVYANAGKYYAAPFASDGGAPSTADLKGLFAVQGFSLSPNASINLIGSTQQINPAGLVAGAVDAGVNGGSGAYEGWVQLAIDGGWGNYASDAGLCYVDGGACVLINNALAGDFIQITAGTGAGTIAPIVSNDSRVITYVLQATSYGTVPTPDGTTKYNLFSNASHFYPYPVDAGASTSYELATVWVGGNGVQNGTDDILSTINATSTFAYYPQITFNYVDLVDAPQGTLSNYEAIDNFGPGLFSLRYSNIETTSAGTAANNYAGTLELGADYIKPTGATAIVSESGTIKLTGDEITTVGTGAVASIAGTDLVMYTDVLQPAASNVNAIVADQQSNIVAWSTLLDQNNNAAKAAILTSHNSNAYIGNLSYLSDGGAGLIACGASGNIAFRTYQIPDAGTNLVSLDNAATWSTGTAYSTQDGGTAGVHALLNVGSGCGYTSY